MTVAFIISDIDILVGKKVVKNLDEKGHATDAIDDIIKFDTSKCTLLYMLIIAYQRLSCAELAISDWNILVATPN